MNTEDIKIIHQDFLKAKKMQEENIAFLVVLVEIISSYLSKILNVKHVDAPV
jgi:hypothetical protein